MRYIAARFFLWSLSCCLGASLVLPKAHAEEKTTMVGYFTAESQDTFEKKIKPFFDANKSPCKTCELVNLTPYDEKGNYSEKDLVDRIKKAPPEITLFFISWNRKYTDQNKDLVDALTEKTEAGKMVISPTGYPPEKEPSMPLSRTVMGQAKDIIILGELTDRDRLHPPQSYFGPEMLTAIRPPKEYIGQGMGPLYFVSRLAGAWSRHTPVEWLQHFKTKKMKSRKIWLEVDDLLSR